MSGKKGASITGGTMVANAIAFLCAFCAMCSTAMAAENYCDDRRVNAEWERLLLRHEGDPAVAYLYSLRQELCAGVDAGKLSLDDAIDQFEAQRQRVIEERQERSQERERSPVLAG